MNFKYYDIISTLISGVVLLFVVSIVINWDISKVNVVIAGVENTTNAPNQKNSD